MAEKLRFDEGFDNILIYDYDAEYKNGRRITADTLMKTGGRELTSLNGDWHFSPDVFCSMVRSRWFDETKFNRDHMPIPYDFSFDEWDTIKVPGVWNNQKPEYALYEGAGIYFREFDWQSHPGKRVFLKLGGANYETRIWLNKTYLGRHLGGFTPFCVEITKQLQEKNRLMILVDNTRRGEQVPSLHYDWFNYGGIHRSVELVETPETFLKDFTLQLSRENPGKLEYRVCVAAADAAPGGRLDGAGSAAVEAVIRIPELKLEQTVSCIRNAERYAEGDSGEEQGDAAGTLYIAEGVLTATEENMKLWSPERPYLYEVQVACQGDRLSEKIGFRRIERRGCEIFLNGRPIFLKGMCVHEESPKHLRCETEEEMRQTIETVKSLGCNFLRLTHYPHNERMAGLADQLGILLLEEIPVYWALEFENPKTYEDAENQLREMILRDRNRASVILFSMGNENPDTDSRYQFMEKLADTAKSLDKTRLIAASCLIDVEQKKIRDRLTAKLDVIGINEYYGWYIKDFGVLEEILNNYSEDKPIIITETGADAVSGMQGEELYSEELQAAVYKKQFEILFSYPFIRGITPWVLYDYASMRRMSVLQRGYNLKGIISADRTHQKLACQVVKAAYARIDQNGAAAPAAEAKPQ